MSIQQLVDEYNRTATSPYVKLTPEIAQFLEKLAHDNGAGSDLELIANHTLLQAKMHHAIYERRVLERMASEEAVAVNKNTATAAPEPEPEHDKTETSFRTGIPEIDSFIQSIEEAGGTVIGGKSNNPLVGLGGGLLGALVGASNLGDIYNRVGIKPKTGNGPCPGCGGNH